MNLQNIEFVELSSDLKNEFLEMAADYQSTGDDRYQSAAEDFENYLERLKMYRTGENLPSHLVRANTFFLLTDGKLMGRGDLRHQLNEILAERGGHIGYDVRPSERRKGCGSLILELTLEKARALGLKKVFLTCDTDNIASAKIIEKQGGKLQDQIIYEETGKLISRYWIELN